MFKNGLPLVHQEFPCQSRDTLESGGGFDDLESTISNAWLFILVTNDQLTIRKSSSQHVDPTFSPNFFEAFEQYAIQPKSGSQLVLHSTSASCLEATKAQAWWHGKKEVICFPSFPGVRWEVRLIFSLNCQVFGCS